MIIKQNSTVVRTEMKAMRSYFEYVIKLKRHKGVKCFVPFYYYPAIPFYGE